MTKPPIGTVPFDSSDLTQVKSQRKRKTFPSVTPAPRPPPPPPPSKETNMVGGAPEKKAQLPGLNRQTNDYLTSARAHDRTSCLLVPSVGVLTHARCLACKDCVRGIPFQTKLALSQFPVTTYHIISTNKPCSVRYFVSGGRYFVNGQNHPLLNIVRIAYPLSFSES